MCNETDDEVLFLKSRVNELEAEVQELTKCLNSARQELDELRFMYDGLRD